MSNLAETLANTLAEVERALGESVSAAMANGASSGLGDEAVLTTMAAAARISRLAEALVVEMTAQVGERSETGGDERMTARYGCRSAKELVQRTTLGSSRRVGEIVRGADAITRRVSLSSGSVLSARYPALREAMADGVLGLDGLVAVTGALDGAACSEVARFGADVELAASARGEGADGGPAPCVDDLRAQATVWAMFLDQDGAEPRESRAMRKRRIVFGVCRDGIVPISGGLLPEVAAQWQRIEDAMLNPKGDGPDIPRGPFFTTAGPVAPSDEDGCAPFPEQADLRTRGQKRHDVFATILSVAARSGELPTLGGAAPTLVVEARAEDLASGTGYAHLDGCDEPVSLAVARHVACTGVMQRMILDANGRVVQIGIIDRVFAAHQRKAISLRDGGCVIPGCHVRAAWCEIHHVREWADGGPTHTDNGVLLCWFHHRTLDDSGWKVRMNHGVPEVKGPYWWDAYLRWRPTTKSPIRMRQRHSAAAGGT